jgi:hypothetical protein
MSKKMTRRSKQPQEHSARLLRILQTNLENARDPALRERLQRAIRSLQERQKAA